MSSERNKYRYWIIPEVVWEEYQEEVRVANGAIWALESEIGAKGSAQDPNHGKTVGFAFENEPDRKHWKLAKKNGIDPDTKKLCKLYLPKKNTKWGKALANRIENLLRTHSREKIGLFFLGQALAFDDKKLRIEFPFFEHVNDRRVVSALDIEGQWEHPHTQIREIKSSEYWQMVEEEEEHGKNTAAIEDGEAQEA